MKKLLCAMGLVLFFATLAWFPQGNVTQAMAASAPLPQEQAAAACNFPTQMASTPEQTAWQIFVAASCTAGTQYPFVVWETWPNQTDVYQTSAAAATGAPHRFVVSPLGKKLRTTGKKRVKRQLAPEVANENCNSQTWTGRTICEEARLNPAAAAYVKSNGLNTLQGQEQFVSQGNTFQFTPPSIEIKGDWIQLASCTNPPQGVHVELVDGKCYALGGVHVISKLIDKWVWATFEPQNPITNPRRCQVLGCVDKWGSVPARTTGASTNLTPALQALMKQANLAPEWANYRLDGVQVDFVDASGKPTRLGNSIIEGENAGTPAQMKVSSCITCHDLSSMNAQGKEGNPNFIIGPPKPIAPGFVRRDFVWSLTCVNQGNCP